MALLFLAGLGLFLFGMYLLEDALRKLSGATFRNILRRYTQNRIRAITSGALITAIVQSSTATSLIVLAFVGAGILHLQSAIGVIIGANLGTSVTSWIVAGVGFKVDIQWVARPMLAIGGLGLVLFRNNKKLTYIFHLFAGLGVLFTGLDFMKDSTAHLAENIDPEFVQGYHFLVFFLAGALLSALLQSSSASIAIVMTSLFAGILTFHQSAATVIGTTIGTTLTIIIASVGGEINKKRLAFTHLFFNSVSSLIGLILLFPLSYLILEWMGFAEHPVVGLAIFHTLFILIGILIQLPFIPVLSWFIARILPKKEQVLTHYLHNDQLNVTEIAMEGVKKETGSLILLIAYYQSQILHTLPPEKAQKPRWTNKTPDELYQMMKYVHGEIVHFSALLQNQELEHENATLLNQYLEAARNSTTSAKYIKDITHNLEQFDNAEHEFLQKKFPEKVHQFYKAELHNIAELLSADENESLFKEIWNLKTRKEEFEQELSEDINEAIKSKDFPATQISSLLHVKSNIIRSFEQLIQSLQSLLLPTQEKKIFSAISEEE